MGLNLFFVAGATGEGYADLLSREISLYAERFQHRNLTQTWFRGAPLSAMKSGELTELAFHTNMSFSSEFSAAGEYGFECVTTDITEANLALMKGLRFKEKPFLDSVTSSTHFVSPAVYGLVLAGAEFTTALWLILAAFFLWGIASHAFGAVQDVIDQYEVARRLHEVQCTAGLQTALEILRKHEGLIESVTGLHRDDVIDPETADRGTIRVRIHGSEDRPAKILKEMVLADVEVIALSAVRTELEDVYQSIGRDEVA